MAIEYKWTISALDTLRSANGLSDIVQVIHWRYIAKEDTYYTETYGAVSLDPPEAENFTAFNDLTEEQVVAWLSNKLDVPAMQLQLQKSLEELKNPPTATLSPPWVSRV